MGGASMRQWVQGLHWAGLMAALSLAGCDRELPLRPTAKGVRQASVAFAPAPPQPAGMHLAFVHAIGLQVAAGALPAHFAAARDRCVGTPALHCLLLAASLDTPGSAQDGPGLSSAHLQLRLPHDQVAPFANALTAPLPGERAGSVQVLRQSVTAEDLGRPIQDAAQRIAQLTDYLASLKTLGSRLTISVSDLVKIASETAQAQTQMEEIQAQARDLALRVDTEELDIDMMPLAAAVQPADPIAGVLDGARASLRANAAEALRTAIAALAWTPLAVLGLLALWIIRAIVAPRRARP